MDELLIRGGLVLDGTGHPGYRGNVLLRGGQIAAVGAEPLDRAGRGDWKLGGAGRGAAVLEADGLAVAPGFVDLHTHSELALLADPGHPFKVAQGVTTEVVGNCGFSAAPVMTEGIAGSSAGSSAGSAASFRELAAPVFGHNEVVWDWSDLPGYLRRLETQGSSCNVATLVGHGALRAAVLGFDDRPPSAAELSAMQAQLADCLAEGALGLSTGLIYVPGCYADTAELIALGQVLGRHGGVYVTHLRNQSDRLLEAVSEALTIGRQGGCAVQISHHKCAGPANQGKVVESLALLDAAMAEGLTTGSDMYPYLAGSSTLVSLFPPWALAGGLARLLERLAAPDTRARIVRDFREGLPGWENRTRSTGWERIYISSLGQGLTGVDLANAGLTGADLAGDQASGLDPARANTQPAGDHLEAEHLMGKQLRGEQLVGKQFAEIGRGLGISPEEAACRVVLAAKGQVGYIGYNSSEADLETMLRHPRTSVGSDGLDVGQRPHPRLYGTFPRVLGHYSRERGVIDLPTAVHKLTALPAAQMGLRNIGRLAPGYRADVVLFDPQTVADRATFDNPRQYPAGVPYVFVGGVAVVKQGHFTGALPGQVLRRQRSQKSPTAN